MIFKKVTIPRTNSKSFLMSPQHIIEDPTGPSFQDLSLNDSFEGCFSFNNEEAGSGLYALIGPDGQANSLIKIKD
jgi:hypothetical protein